MSQVQISSDEVLQYANQMMSMKEEVAALFSEIQSKMNTMNSVWNSPAGEKLVSQFQSLKPSFDQYVEALNQYGVYLQKTAESYQENETMLTQGIEE